MKKRGFFLLLFIMPTLAVASVCDYAELALRNKTPQDLLFVRKDLYRRSTIRHIHPGDKIVSGTMANWRMFSGFLTGGIAEGTLTFASMGRSHEGNVVELLYRAEPNGPNCHVGAFTKIISGNLHFDLDFDQGKGKRPGKIYVTVMEVV